MNTNIKRLLDPRQLTNQSNTSNNVKEIEMKTRTISKKAILGPAIGTGLIAGFSVILSGSETRAFNPAEAARTANAGLVIDETQEVGGYVAPSQRLVIDERKPGSRWLHGFQADPGSGNGHRRRSGSWRIPGGEGLPGPRIGL